MLRISFVFLAFLVFGLVNAFPMTPVVAQMPTVPLGDVLKDLVQNKNALVQKVHGTHRYCLGTTSKGNKHRHRLVRVCVKWRHRRCVKWRTSYATQQCRL